MISIDYTDHTLFDTTHTCKYEDMGALEAIHLLENQGYEQEDMLTAEDGVKIYFSKGPSYSAVLSTNEPE